MIRTQVYLTNDQHSTINLLAGKEQKPKAQVMREVLQIGLKEKGNQQSVSDAFRRLANLGIQGPANLSAKIDDYLYGDEK